MNQVQNVGGKNIKVRSLDEKYSGYSSIKDSKNSDYSIEKEASKNSTAETINNKMSRGINASGLSSGAEISKIQHVNEKLLTQKERGELDLTGEDISIDKELPKAPASLFMDNSMNTSDVDTEKSPEMSNEDLVKAESQIAEGLERLIKDQKTSSESVNEQESKYTVSEGDDLSKLGEFMNNTKNTEMSAGDITTTRNVESVFDSVDLSVLIEDIKSAEKSAEMAQKEFDEEMQVLQAVDRSSIETLGVNKSSIMGANKGDLKDLEERSIAQKNLVEDKINKLKRLIKDDPKILTTLRANTKAVAIPKIKALLEDTARVTPTTEAGVVDNKELLPVDTAEDIKIVDESTVEVIVRGSLLEAISDAVTVLTDGGSEEIKIASDMAFHSLIETKIKQFEESGKFTHKEVYAKVSDLIKNSNKIKVSLRDGMGIVVDVLKLKPKAKIMSSINAPENLADSAADGHDEQIAA